MNASQYFRIFDNAFRATALLFSVILFIFMMIASAQIAFAVTLKPQAVLNGDTLKVSDIFDSAGKNADLVLGPAPQPGKTMTLDSSTLLRIARALDIDWQPESSSDHVIVTRSSTVIPSDVVAEAISNTLRDKVADEKFTLDTGAMSLELTLPSEVAPTVDITNTTYNARTNRFEATISAPSAAHPVKQMVVAGSVRPITSIPVLKTSLRNGDIIGNSDIEWVDFYTNEIQPDTLLKTEDVIGMTPRRIAAGGKALRVSEIQAPQLVGRGDNVTIVFTTGTLSLSATGKALQNGAKGELIRVVNNNSNRSIDATVSGDHEVIVRQ